MFWHHNCQRSQVRHQGSEAGWRLWVLDTFVCLQEQISGFPESSVGKETSCSAGDPGLIPGLGRCPGEGKGYSLQYSGLENSMDCIVHGVAQSQTWLSDFHFASRTDHSEPGTGSSWFPTIWLVNTTQTFTCVPMARKTKWSLFGKLLKCRQITSDWHIQDKKRIWRNLSESLSDPRKTAHARFMLSSMYHDLQRELTVF